MDIEKKHLLKKFLDGQCTDMEQQAVKILLNTPEGKTMMEELMIEQEDELDLSASHTEDNLMAKVQDWKMQVHQRIALDEKIRPRGVRKMNFLRYAAMFGGILLTASLAFWQMNKNSTTVYVERTNAQGTPVRYMLPDSSSIYLAAGSTLKYPERFPETERSIELKGEAFFDVTPDIERPFIIHSGTIQTRVLGTSFKVSAFAGELLEVEVATGKVSVSAHEEKGNRELAILTPGLKVLYNPQTGEAFTSKTDIYGLEQWKTGELVFDEQPLSQVVTDLQRRYGVTIVCKDPETAGYRVSGTFAATERVSQVIKMLSILGKFNYKTQGDSTYYLYKPNHHMEGKK